jgi:hypothetical protein
MAEPIAQYTFLPWARQGLATEITSDDDLGARTAVAPLERVVLPVSVAIEYDPLGGTVPALAPPIERGVGLIGPGDILGLDAAAVLRCHPANNSVGVDASKLAYVELYDEDLPWRYTPARPGLDGRLRPWIALWVLAEDEFTILPEQVGRPSAIHLDPAKIATSLPPALESWAWAHVQISRAVVVADVDAAIRGNPDHALSRLVCPRRLRVDTRYHAFIVPAFETGRLAGLGADPSAVPAQAPSWTSDGTPVTPTRPFDVPFYYRWTFTTGETGDFESLVRALQPGPVGDRFGKRALDMSEPGYGLTPGAMVELEGALQPIAMERAPFAAVPGATLVDQLERLLDLTSRLAAGDPPELVHPFHRPGETGAYPADIGDDPIVTPPIYGQHHALVGRLADVRGDAGRAWLRELNLDPRSRAVAGLGTEVVRTRQEELVERAWEQVAELEHVNQRLREAEMALAITESLHAKHIAAATPERAVALTAGLQARVLGASGAITLRREIEGSKVPIALQTAAFKRISRPQRKWIRRLAGSGNVAGLHHDLVANFNRTANPVSAAPPATTPATALAIASVVDAVGDTVADYDADATHPGHVFLLILSESIQALLTANPALDLNSLPLSQIKASLHVLLTARAPSLATDVVATVGNLVDELIALVADGPGMLGAEIPAARFTEVFGGGVEGKSYGGITVRPQGAGEVDGARTIDRSSLQAFEANVSAFVENVLEARPEPFPRPALASVPALADRAVVATNPRATMTRRIANAVEGVPLPDSDRARALRPVMAYPEFAEAMFEDLRKQSQDYVIPNFTDLPANTITILTPNQRFIEAYLAGLNHEMARELLWREYPTDQRGTYFRRFWDRADNVGTATGGDIVPMHEWQDELGSHAPDGGGFLVLVIRGELLRRYPSTVVYAQRAVFSADGVDAPRVLAPDEDATAHRFPVLRGWLDPDVALFGFALGVDEVRGRRHAGPDGPADPGWFFVLRERPGEIELGLDDVPADEPLPTLASWNDLSWRHLQFATASPSHISLGANSGLTLAAATSPPGPRAGVWGQSAADQAYILMQSPILYARHAEELLPPRTP